MVYVVEEHCVLLRRNLSLGYFGVEDSDWVMSL